MLQAAKDLQNNAVSELVNILDIKYEITFKAPTGSGKTRMMSDFMNRVLSVDDDVIFIVSTLSKGDLSRQNYESFKEYSIFDFPCLKPFLISSEDGGENRLDIPTDYNVYVLPRDLYKEKSKLKDQGVFVDFLNCFEGVFTACPKKIYLIKDECHIATKNLDGLSVYFDKIINFSATPNKKQYPNVEIKELDAINAKLIKSVEYLDEDLENALDKFLELRNDYINDLGINPCMIIQISNKGKEEKELEDIKNTLSKLKYKDLKWISIADKPSKCDTNDNFKAKKLPVNKWKDYAKGNDSLIDIIIFKMVISEGWDIPRACMLYQVRDTTSKQLDEQVIGRVRRNPKLVEYINLSDEQREIINTAYVYSIKPENESLIQVRLRDSAKRQIEARTTRLPDERVAVSNKDIDDALKDIKVLATKNIFELHRDCSANSNIQNICDSYIGSDVDKWVKFADNKEIIEKLVKKVYKDYSKMQANIQKVSLPIKSLYSLTDYNRNITNWVWLREDGDDEFHFDSEAEKEWMKKLQNLAKKKTAGENIIKCLMDENNKTSNNELFTDEEEYFLIAKNFLENSEIFYEYYNYGIHKSYPDFILKDHKNRIHIFEVKSLNTSNSLDINSQEYKDKVEALLECYTHVSNLLYEYRFYIPIMCGKDWTIYEMYQGKQNKITEKDLEKNLSL